MSVCPPSQYGQSSSVFTFNTRGFVDFTDLLFLVSDFHIVFRRGSSSRSTSTTKINIHEDCLFKRSGFPYLVVKWQGCILLHFLLPSVTNYRLRRYPNSMYQSSNGWYWFKGAGIVRLDLEQGSWCLITTGRSDVVEDNDKNLWIAVFGHLYKYPLNR